MKYCAKEKLPPPGLVVRVVGIVRYGRKKRTMAAKRVIESNYPSYNDHILWMALKPNSAYTETIELKEVISWEHL